MDLNMLRRFSAWVLACVMTLTLVTVPAAAANEYTVKLNSSEVSLTEGETHSMRATVTEGETLIFENQKNWTGLVWTSSDPTVATIGKTAGKITAVGAGTAVITATYTYTEGDPAVTKTGSATCKVTVEKRQVPVASLELTADVDLLRPVAVNVPVIFTAYPSAEDGVSEPTEELVWSVESLSPGGTAALTKNEDGTRTFAGKDPGEFKVKVAAEDGEPYDECTVTVSGVILDTASLRMLVGDTKTLTARCFGNAPEESAIVWNSTNISVAEVIDGRVIGHYPGKTTITATAGAYKATCTVTVEEDVAEAIITSATAGVAMPFSGLTSDLNSRARKKTESALSYVNSLQVSPSEGTLYYGYVSTDNPGTGVGSESYYAAPGNGQLDLKKVYFVAAPDFSGTAIISYTGRGANGRNFNGTIRVNVSAAGDVSYNTSADQPVHFKASDFSTVCIAKTGKDISSISFVAPTSKAGVLHYNYGGENVYNPEVTTDISIYRTKAPYLDDVVFVPNPEYSGNVEITYYCTTSAGTHTGKVTIRVAGVEKVEDERITYDVAAGRHVDLDVDDFDRLSRERTGSSLSYVYFELPNAAEGMLYYNYVSDYSYNSLVSENTRYYRSSSPRIAYITFVAAGRYSGEVLVPFTGYSVSGETFSGEVVFRVDGYDGVVSYRSNYGEAVYFNGADFNELCLSQNGRSLNYVCFEQPGSGHGTLYRSTSYTSGTKVSSSTKFYRSGGSYQIDDVVFVPNSSYTGTFDIPFSGYDVSGGRFSGMVQVSVERQAGGLVVSYQTVSGGVVDFNAQDFNIACQLATGERLNYVRFTLPSTSSGKLYYNYNTTSGTGTSVSSNMSYYRTNATRLLDNVSFKVADNYDGIVTIRYTGTGTSGTRYSGTIEVAVSTAGGVSVNYAGSSVPIRLKAADFETAYKRLTGKNLSYVRFTALPAATEGKLYLNYTSAMRMGTAVKTDINYSVKASPSVEQITFVPKAGYQGYVEVPFVGVSTDGRSVAGALRLDLSNKYLPSHFTDLTGYDTAKPSVEFLYDAGVAKGYGNGTYGPGRSISRGEFTVMVYRAFELPNAQSSYSFPDVPLDQFYAPAVAAAKALGIVQGYGEAFMPESTITRQDAMTIVMRAMEATGRTVPYVSTSILQSYADGNQVSNYATVPVSAMVYLGAVDVNAARQIRPFAPLTRAEMAVLLHYILTQ